MICSLFNLHNFFDRINQNTPAIFIEINLTTFQSKSNGFFKQKGKELYFSESLKNQINNIQDLNHLEYGIAVEIDKTNKTVSFGRDYLGHYPLVYLYGNNTLIISDQIRPIIDWAKKNLFSLTISEEAVALYFTMNYIPHGYTLFNEIKTAENASIYHWKNNRIAKTNLFKPIKIIKNTISSLHNVIENSVKSLTCRFDHVDIWCSGGLDSTLITAIAQKHHQNIRLLTTS